MTRPMKVYLTLFLAMGVPFAIFEGLWGESVLIGIGSGIFFGGFMSAILGSMQLRAERQQGIAGVRASQTIELQQSATDAFPRAEAVIRALPATVTRADPSTGTILAKTGVSWKSWGERIEARIVPNQDGHTLITVSSRPSIPTIVADMGKNAQNVRAILDKMTLS